MLTYLRQKPQNAYTRDVIAQHAPINMNGERPFSAFSLQF